MKILLISNYCEGVGGISVQVKSLRDHLRGEGINADIFSTKGSFLFRIEAFIRLFSSSRAYDVFHIHACSDRGFLPAIFGITVGRFLHKRVVLTYHGGGAEEFFKKHTKLVRFFLNRTDTNIVLSGFLGKLFDKYRIPYTIIPNIIELDSSHYKERQTIKPNFISIRTLSPLYNIECILRAYKQVKLQIPNATLRIVGDGPSRASLEDMVKTEGINDVLFVGRVENKEIYNQLDQADILLSAPRIDNMPVSILEAFNAGLLVISSNVGGVPYMIDDKVNGLLFPSNSNDALMERMLWVFAHQDKSLAMISAARQSIDIYSWSTIKKKLLSVYK